jgi:hypothetical protein
MYVQACHEIHRPRDEEMHIVEDLFLHTPVNVCNDVRAECFLLLSPGCRERVLVNCWCPGDTNGLFMPRAMSSVNGHPGLQCKPSRYATVVRVPVQLTY